MATDKPRFTITLEPELLEEVLSYKSANRMATQSRAIQRLIEIGIQETSSSSPPLTLSRAELQLVEDYRDASSEIRGAAALMLHNSAEEARKKLASSASL